jgi:hypothetical protein
MYNPALWTRKTIDQLWDQFLTIWTCQNGEKFGNDYEEQREIALQMTQKEAQAVYEEARH